MADGARPQMRAGEPPRCTDDGRVVDGSWAAMRNHLRYLGRALGAFLFPPRCAACRSFWSQSFETDAGASASPDALTHVRGLLCPGCLDGCRLLQSPMCSRCGLMFKSRVGGDHLCSDCLTGKGHYGIARAVGVYQGGLMDLVHQLKYQGRLALVPAMGPMLGDAYRHHWHERQVDRVIPVPLHPRRLRRRGFNQASLLLRAWRKSAADEEAPPGVEENAPVLARIRSTRPQTGLDRRERRRNIRGAFRVVDREGVKNQHLLLLDDVFTTGATVEEAARVLLSAGAASVDVLTFVRTLR